MNSRRILAGPTPLLWCLLLLPVPGLGHDSTEAACRSLVEAYAYHRDRLDADGVAGLFTEHGVLEIMGERFTGRDAIRQRLLAARDGPITRHMLSTIRIEADGPDRARGVSYVTIYQAPRAVESADVRANLRIIGEYHDRFERTERGWRIGARRFEPVMTP